jgi:phosphate transport system permease protein
MAVFITVGGLSIIGAVLAMLLFMAKEAAPLFLPPLVRPVEAPALASLPTAPEGAWLDESGKVAVLLSRGQGLQARLIPEGTSLPLVPEGPALPWRQFTRPEANGALVVVGADGRASLAHLVWAKAPGENNPANWSLEPHWEGHFPLPAQAEILHHRTMTGGGLGGGATLRLLVRIGPDLAWADLPLDSEQPVNWQRLPLEAGLQPTAALLSADGKEAFVGTQDGRLLNLDLEGGTVNATAVFGEAVSSLGFVLGQQSLLAGGIAGKLIAYQRARVGETFQLQAFHTFPSLQGPVLGFQSSLRDKRFLAWTPTVAVVDHLSTERRLFSAPVHGAGMAALAPRGDLILHAPQATGDLRLWSLAAPHPEVSFQLLWGKTHYEGYNQPEYVWQSTGGTDDFEPKFSLIPLIFGTLKGTLYAMLFAFPLAVLGALYTSQFASARLKNAIKPTIEIMAALPSVVLGFLAGLVIAPLLERAAVGVMIYPLLVLFLVLVALPIWRAFPQPFRRTFGEGREVLWMIPLLLLSVWLAAQTAPWVERAFMGGSYRTWLQTTFGVAYDQRNSLVVGFAMGFAVIPIIFTISEDALSSVPRSLTSASLACGASPWQTAWRVVLPTASPGIFSATMVGLGRAIGETMIVLMATGNTPVMDWSPFNGMRTLSANIAVEIPEAPLHGTLYRVLFLAAFLLFVFTFLLNTVAELVRQHLRRRYESL